MAEAKLTQLTFDINKPATTFINELRVPQENVIGTKGYCSESMIVNKVTRCLPADRCGNFLTTMSNLRDRPASKEMKLSDFVKHLVYAEDFLPKKKAKSQVKLSKGNGTRDT